MDSLNERGYVFLKSVVKDDIIAYTNAQINNFIKDEHIFTKMNSREDIKSDKYYVNNNYSVLNSFNKIQFYRTPVFNVGGNKDTVTNKGLIEVYNPERVMTFLNNTIDTTLIKTIMKKLTNIDWKFSRMSLKFSNSVLKPEKVHNDDHETCLKCCIYLTDVLDYNCGPNVYIEGSHQDNENIHDRSKIKVFNGKKGDILISFQNGYHGRLANPNLITAYLTLYFIPANPKYSKFNDYIAFSRFNNNSNSTSVSM